MQTYACEFTPPRPGIISVMISAILLPPALEIHVAPADPISPVTGSTAIMEKVSCAFMETLKS